MLLFAVNNFGQQDHEYRRVRLKGYRRFRKMFGLWGMSNGEFSIWLCKDPSLPSFPPTSPLIDLNGRCSVTNDRRPPRNDLQFTCFAWELTRRQPSSGNGVILEASNCFWEIFQKIKIKLNFPLTQPLYTVTVTVQLAPLRFISKTKLDTDWYRANPIP